VTITSCSAGSLMTGTTGTFNCTLTAPNGTSGTSVVATDPGGQTATGTFTVVSGNDPAGNSAARWKRESALA
jgi:hypothetical protein